MAGGGDDRETVSVKTYVSAHQREIWRAEADEMDMTLSEFVATMVQADRRDIKLKGEERTHEDATPGGEALEERILEALKEEGPLEWDDLVKAVYGDWEADLDEALGRLQDANKIQYSGRLGGYTLTEDSDE